MKKLLIILIFTLGFGQINWTYETVDSVNYPSDGGMGYASLKLDSLTSPHLVYYQLIWDTLYSDTGWAKVIYTYKISDQWIKETVDSSFGNGWTNYYIQPSLCLDRYDNLHIAYVHRTEDNLCYLRYANKVSGNWLIQELDTMLHYWSSATIALNANDYPCIAYLQYRDVDSTLYVKYLNHDGVLWDSLVIDDGNNLSDGGLSLAIDSSNNPHIAYYQACDPLSDSVKYVYWDGANWVFSWSDSICDMSEHGSLSLALNTFDHPHIAYCTWPSLWYAYWDGNSWYNEGPIDAASWEIRLDLDSLNLPHIAYIDQMGQRPEYCYRDSIAWHLCGFVEPDPEAFTYRSISFSLDKESNPHVAYIANKNNQLKMKYAIGAFVGIKETESSNHMHRFKLEISPNPAKGMLKIRFNSPDERKVTVKIYDVVGRLAEKVFDGKAKIGVNEFLIMPRELSAGVYFVRLETAGYERTEKIILLR